jgi:hypothetical protein
MTMLMHARGPFERAPASSEGRDTVGAGPEQAHENTHLAMIKRFCLCALVALLAGGALAGIMAIKVAAFFWRFHYS